MEKVHKVFLHQKKLDKIHKQSTEIYFWGIPSSGKSCALGAILSVAASGKVAHSMDADTESQGYGYMTKLINLFQNGEIGTLMEGTSVDSFYEMGFDLVISTMHKNLPGPQRAFIASKKADEKWDKLRSAISTYVSNMHVFSIYSAGLLLNHLDELKTTV